jgi:hypothetical protein
VESGAPDLALQMPAEHALGAGTLEETMNSSSTPG